MMKMTACNKQTHPASEPCEPGVRARPHVAEGDARTQSRNNRTDFHMLPPNMYSTGPGDTVQYYLDRDPIYKQALDPATDPGHRDWCMHMANWRADRDFRRNNPLAYRQTKQAKENAAASALEGRETEQQLIDVRNQIRAGPNLSDQAKKILLLTMQIPYGEHSTYVAIADHLSTVGKMCPKRNIGGALAKNPLPGIVPCHRVVAKNGIGAVGTD